METIAQKRFDMKFWLLWGAVNAIGLGIISFSHIIIMLVMYMVGQGFTVGVFLMLTFLSGIWGFAQWLVLKSYSKNVSLFWIVVAALTWPASMWILTMIPVSLVAYGFFWLYFVTGLIAGLAQWLVLRRSLKEDLSLIGSIGISYTIAFGVALVAVVQLLSFLFS